MDDEVSMLACSPEEVRGVVDQALTVQELLAYVIAEAIWMAIVVLKIDHDQRRIFGGGHDTTPRETLYDASTMADTARASFC